MHGVCCFRLTLFTNSTLLSTNRLGCLSDKLVPMKEKYDTDSDAENPKVDNDEEDSLDNLVFLPAVTMRSG